MATGISGPLVPWTDDFNAGEPEGIGYYEVTQRNGRRWDARRAFIDPIRNRPNLKILENALVEKVAFDGSRADTVIFTRSGERMSAKARGEVILAAGAILSPYLLERSGIGSPGVLKQAGIAPRVELPGVGENLQDHLQVRTIWRLSGVTTLNQQLGSWLGQLGMAMRYLVARSGPVTMAPAQLGIFARSRPDKEIPDLQYLVVPYSADRVGGAPHDFPGITMSVCQLDPASRGSVHVSPAQPAGSPVIRANYLSADEDRRVMIDAVRQTRRIMTLPSLADLAPVEVSPGPQVESDADILAFIRRTATSVFHPVGTCRMGTDDGAVVDPGLRVRGVEALRVVDASVMPLLPAANTGGPTMMIAEKAADLIRRDRVARAR
jgi:choline dehydrogenase